MLEQLKIGFRQPPSDYRPAPLWVWNDEMTRETIRTQLTELKNHGFGGAFVHPRPGLVTEYLSEAWFERWRDALEAARELGLKLYIYDENSYPSGFAGGHVPSRLPDCLANSVNMKKLDRSQAIGLSGSEALMVVRPGHPIRAYAYEEIGSGASTKVRILRDVTDIPASRWLEYGDDFLIFELGTPETNAWLGGFAYADMLRPEVTEVFLETTYEAYASRFGAEFGGAIPAVFTDEPEVSPGNLFQRGGNFLPFTYWFASQFERRNGYDLKDYLYCLFVDAEEAFVGKDPLQVRYDYYSTIRELWVGNSVKPISDWCKEHQIAYTGHYLEHQWPYPWGRTSPSVMSLYEYMDWPAIDMLMSFLLKEDGTEPLMTWAIKEAASVANQLGKSRVLCESYGAGGWDSTFDDYKRIGDWLYVHGINFMNQHLTYSTIAGARKRDHPQSFDWRQPWWEEYAELNEYFGRLSLTLSQGQSRNRILLLNPTTSFYLLTPEYADPESALLTGKNSEQDLVLAQRLNDLHWDYDMGDEYIIERHGRAESPLFSLGSRDYEIVILPAGMTNLRGATFELLLKYLESGGQVISMNAGEIRVDGARDSRVERLRLHPNLVRANTYGELERLLRDWMTPRVEFQGSPEHTRGLSHMRRELDDGSRVYFFVNSGPREIRDSMLLQGARAERWNAWTGETEPIAYETVGDKLRVDVALPASGSLLLLVYSDAEERVGYSPEKVAGHAEAAAEETPLAIAPERMNSFIIDYCDLKVGSAEYREINTIQAGIKAFEKHGFAANPWDNGIQFERRLLDRNRYFGADSGFEVAYSFEIMDGQVPESLSLIVERAELYAVRVNGRPVEAAATGSFLDHRTSRFDLSGLAREGTNRISLTAAPFNMLHEIEAVYLEGDFGVWNVDGTWKLGAPTELKLGSWVEQGRPFYSGAVLYSKKVHAAADFGQALLTLNRWTGTVASVRVNGEKAGLIGAGTGDSLDISSFLREGWNDIEVRISGSYKNLLGPHHDSAKPRNLAWPPHWKKAPMYGTPPAGAYDLIDYGLFEDFGIRFAK